MTKIRADIYAWLPQPDVPNPLFEAARLSEALRTALGKNVCGSRFGGDNFTYPPKAPTGWGGLTFRATQSVEFAFDSFGAAAVVSDDPGVKTGLTTVLTKERALGGTVCHSMRATVMRSPAATAEWSAGNQWYELKFSGAAQDPVPADAARSMVGNRAASVAAVMVPNLSWDVCLRFQQGSELPLTTRARYAFSSPLSLDCSAQTTGAAVPSSNLAHGTITVTQFPSYVLYLTTADAAGIPAVQMAYFADASTRWAALGRILVAQTDVLRPLSW